MEKIYLVTTLVENRVEGNDAYAEPFNDIDEAVSYLKEEIDNYSDDESELNLNPDDVNWDMVFENTIPTFRLDSNGQTVSFTVREIEMQK